MKMSGDFSQFAKAFKALIAKARTPSRNSKKTQTSDI